MRTANERWRRKDAAAAVRVLLLVSSFALVASALSFPAPAAADDEAFAFSPNLLTVAGFRDTGDGVPLIHGFSRTIAPRWKASYGLGLAEETALTSSYLRFDQTLAYGTRSDLSSRENWRHFLGLEYSPVSSFSLLGGIAKASGITGYRGASISPTGYERIRLNAGARWAMDESWTLDGSFSFIPNGASRFPSDAGYIPGLGDSAPTYFLSLTVSHRF